MEGRILKDDVPTEAVKVNKGVVGVQEVLEG